MASFLLLVALPGIVIPLVCGVLVLTHSKRGGAGHATCGRCTYDVSATLTSGRVMCPECGERFVDVGVLPARPSNDRRRMILGIALVASSVLTCGNIAILLPVYNAYLRTPQRATPVASPGTGVPIQPPSRSASTAPASTGLPAPELLGETQIDR